MTEITWDDVREEFTFDGSWRDIYILNTDMATWQRMFDGLRSAGYDLAYSRDGMSMELPACAEDAFSRERAPLLAVRLGGVQANCHFFIAEEIEFDIDPRQVIGQAQLDALLGFMRCLATSTGRDTVLCPENRAEIVIFRVCPEGAVDY